MDRLPLARWVVFGVLVSGCDQPQEPTSREEKQFLNDLIPFEVGIAWTYYQFRYGPDGSIDPAFTDSQVVTITGAFRVNGAEGEETLFVTLTRLRGYIDLPVSWMHASRANGIYSRGGISSTDTVFTDALHWKYPVTVGDTWMSPRLVYSLSTGQFYIKDTVTYSCVAVNEAFTTPLGDYSCVVYQYRNKPAEDVNETLEYSVYFAPHVGQVGSRIRIVESDRLIYRLELQRLDLQQTGLSGTVIPPPPVSMHKGPQYLQPTTVHLTDGNLTFF